MHSVRRPTGRGARGSAPVVLVVAVIGALAVLPATRPAPAGAAAGSTPVMRESRVTAAEIASWTRLRIPVTYRASIPIEQLIGFYLDEGEAQGVAGDIAFAQSVLETGWFGFNGSVVEPADNNFGGIGANGMPGHVAEFPTARIGVRAQIQHLWAYADPAAHADGTARPLVDPRFDLVTPKGTAPTWEQMGAGAWAVDPDYGPKVLALYNDLLEVSRIRRWVGDAYHDVLDRSAGANERDWWLSPTETRGRTWVARTLSRSHEGISAWIRERHGQILGREPTPDELAHWTSTVHDGGSLTGVVAALAGSAEAVVGAGGTDAGWVDQLYRTILERPAEPAAVTHWTGAVASGTPREVVVRYVWDSIESRRIRVRALYLEVLDRTAEPAGLAWHADRLSTIDDLALTADLTGSHENFLLAQT